MVLALGIYLSNLEYEIKNSSLVLRLQVGPLSKLRHVSRLSQLGILEPRFRAKSPSGVCVPF